MEVNWQFSLSAAAKIISLHFFFLIGNHRYASKVNTPSNTRVQINESGLAKVGGVKFVVGTCNNENVWSNFRNWG